MSSCFNPRSFFADRERVWAESMMDVSAAVVLACGRAGTAIWSAAISGSAEKSIVGADVELEATTLYVRGGPGFRAPSRLGAIAHPGFRIL